MHVVFDDQGDRCCSSRSNVTRGLLDEKLLPSVLKSVRRRRKSYDNGGDQFMSGLGPGNMMKLWPRGDGRASALLLVAGGALLVTLFYLWPRDTMDTHSMQMAKKAMVSDDLREAIKREVRAEVYESIMETNKNRAGAKMYPPTKILSEIKRMRIVITGGAGFVGSHLVDRLMEGGHEVIVIDNMFTGRKKNVAHWIGHPNFMLIVHDVVEPIMLEVDQIYHLACPASPPHYQYNPIKTIKTSTMGTLNMLGLAKRVRARMLLTSTSEVYGDPTVHPQPESYWGNVNPIGPRACYDEGKRVAETMMYAYKSQGQVEVRVARIFNTFGPRMHPNDGRVVSNFIIQALQGKPITIYGDGHQTRSFQYVDDLVNGLIKLMNSDYDSPVNIGNPQEYTVKDFAELVLDLVGGNSSVVHLPPTTDDPHKRRPDISVAKEQLGWSPQVPVREGLSKTIDYFRKELEDTGEIIPTGPDAAKPKPHNSNN